MYVKLADRLKAAILARVPKAMASATQAIDKTDCSYVDVTLDVYYALTIQCRPNKIFGLASVHADSVFGDGPHELFEDFELVVERAVSLLESRERTEHKTSVSLRELRHTAGRTQNDVANTLIVSNAAVAQMETRGNMRIDTLTDYVRACGFELDISVTIGGRSITLDQFVNSQNRKY